MRIGHASIAENGTSGRNGSKPGDQTKKEVVIRNYYSKPWVYLLRCKDEAKAEQMARACEALCNNDNVGYSQARRLTLNNELKKLNYDYTRLTTPCECDCSSFMAVCAHCANIALSYPGGNAPTTSTMVTIFRQTGLFEVFTDKAYINNEINLKRGDILVGAPATHTVMVLDNGGGRRVLRLGAKGNDVKEAQRLLVSKGFDVRGIDGIMGQNTKNAVVLFQKSVFANPKEWDGVIGAKTWEALTH